jgi:MFS transporter, DHA1 family, multidrug resistance protein
MATIIRDSPLGQIIRFVTRNRVLLYPEERADFKLPDSYYLPGEKRLYLVKPTPNPAEGSDPKYPNVETVVEKTEAVEPAETPEEVESSAEKELDLEKAATVKSIAGSLRRSGTSATSRVGMERVATRVALANSTTQADLEREFTIASQPKGPKEPIHPVTLDDGTILVDFYDTEDPDNPHNWSSKKKAFVSLQI